MSKAMFVIATVLVVGTSAAWAGDEKSNQSAARDAVATASGKGEVKAARVSARAAPTVETRATSAATKASSDVKATHEEEWLRMREGYRDGGY